MNLALYYGSDNTQRLLTFAESQVNHQGSYGNTPLMDAVRVGNENMVKSLLTLRNVNVNIINDQSATAFTLAVWAGFYKITELFLARPDVNTNIQNAQGHTALIIATLNGFVRVVRQLLARNDVDVNVKSNYTALMFAVMNRYNEIVKLLLARDDIDVNLENAVGATAIVIAASMGYEDIFKLFQRHTPIRLKKRRCYSDGINLLITNWRQFLPDWRRRGVGCGIYPKEFKDSAVTWLLVGKRLKLPKDLYYLVLEYVAYLWKLLPEEETAIEPEKKK